MGWGLRGGGSRGGMSLLLFEVCGWMVRELLWEGLLRLDSG